VVTSLTNELWPSAMVISSHSVIVAAGLLWYIKFLITHKSTSSLDRGQTIDINDTDKKLLESNNLKIHNHIKPKNRISIGNGVRIKFKSIPFMIVVVVSISVLLIIITTLSFALFSFFPISSVPSIASDPNREMTQAPTTNTNTIKIGALLPLTEVASSFSKPTEVALEMAVEDVNDNFLKAHSSLRFELVTEDTESDPLKSLEKLKILVENGVRAVIGPATSAELDSVKNYANNNGILLVSHSSTAPSLAIRGDNVFRFVPDDTHQSEAISSLMWNDGIKVVIPFWRNDVYGSELMQAVKENFQEMGGQLVVDNETRYEPRTGQLAASLYRINFALWDKELRNLDSKVQQAISLHGADRVGVYIISLDEITPILIQAYSYPSLSKVKWYGSDGSVHNERLIKNHDSAHFAVNTSFYNPIYSIDHNDSEKLDNHLKQVRKEIGIDSSSPYSAVAYDAFWVLATAENNTRFSSILKNGSFTSSENDNKSNELSIVAGDTAVAGNIHKLKEELVLTANSYHGITGNTTLNTMGDRLGAVYDFWAVRFGNDDKVPFQWKKVGSYTGN